MRLSNAYLHELMVAGSHASAATVVMATAVGHWAVPVLLVAGLAAWVRGTRRLRADLGCVAAGALFAVSLALTASFVHPGGPVNPQVTLWWSVALGMLSCGRLAWLAFPLLAMGLGVGWCLVYIGNDYPLDVLAALPLAASGGLVAAALRHRGRWELR